MGHDIEKPKALNDPWLKRSLMMYEGIKTNVCNESLDFQLCKTDFFKTWEVG